MASTAFAQLVDVPSTAETGRIEQNLNLPNETQRSQITPQDQMDISSDIPKAQNGFELKNIVLKGVTAFSENKFESLISEYQGRNVDINVLNHLAARITQIYRDNGYFLSRAIVPQQEVLQGRVVIQVIEGYIQEVIFDDPEKLLSKDHYKIILGAARHIKEQNPLNGYNLERQILLLNEMTGLSIKTVLKKSEYPLKPGGVNLILLIQPRTTEVAIYYDNYGSRYVGPHRTGFAFTKGNFFTLYDQVSVSTSFSIPFEEVQFGSLKYETMLNRQGLKAYAELSYSNSEPGYLLDPLEAEGDSTIFSTGLSYPVIKSRRTTFIAGAEFTVSNSATEFLDVELVDDKTRDISLYFDYQSDDTWNGVNLVNLELSKGFDILGATKTGSTNLSRTQGRSDFFAAQLDIERIQNLGAYFQLQAKFSGQYAPHPLLSSHEFGYGGANYGRAYDPSEITGDKGISSAIEMRYTGVPYIETLNMSFVPFAYYDVGKVWNHDQSSPPQSGASAGFGLYYNYSQSTISGAIQVAYPLTREVGAPVMNGSDGPRILFSLISRF